MRCKGVFEKRTGIRQRIWLLVIWILLFVIILRVSGVDAQTVNPDWSPPYRLSSETGQAGEQVMFADQFGYVHVFWPETNDLERETVIRYARFDGETWSAPAEIYFSPGSNAVGNIAAMADLSGTLYVVFTQSSDGGPVYFTKAPIQAATSALGWQKPVQLDFIAQKMVLRADPEGVLQLLYTGLIQGQSGVFYTNSVDQGRTWSQPVWLDPELPADLSPDMIQFEIGEGESLHAVWYCVEKRTLLGREIRYAHSFDHGQHWSTPYTIDEVEAGSQELRMAYPALAVEGDILHVIYAGDQPTHRKERISTDSGNTWSAAKFIFGDLLGQAIGDGVAWDALGRLHFFGQIRYPQGIYHAYWYHGGWSKPSLIYLIAREFESIGNRIHAHRVRAAIRAGNQVVLTFTTSPGDPQSILYYMQAMLPDTPGLPPLSLPAMKSTPTSGSEVDLVPEYPLPIEHAVTPYFEPTSENIPSNANMPADALAWGFLPALALVAGIITYRLFIRGRS